jgi:site-specific DNA-cytosine methylase
MDRNNTKYDIDDLIPLIKDIRSARDTSWCVVHNKLCPIVGTDVHIAGTPCPDFSPAGPRTGAAGRTIKYFAAWCASVRRADHTCVIHENSGKFPVALLEATLGDKYVIQSSVVNPSEFGWPTRRERRWTVLLHRIRVSDTMMSLSSFLGTFRRSFAVDCSWKQFCIATDEELDDELRWMAGRPSSRAKGLPLVTRKGRAANPSTPVTSFISTLTMSEFDNLLLYKDLASMTYGEEPFVV